MCGRFTQMFSGGEVRAVLDLDGPDVEFRPRYNLAPGQDAAVVRGETGGRRLSMLRWAARRASIAGTVLLPSLANGSAEHVR